MQSVLHLSRRQALVILGTFPLTGALRAADVPVTSDPLAPWRSNVKIRPVSSAAGRHSIHSYYVKSPESPDGKSVLFYVSTAANGQVGDIVVQDRQTGAERIVARGVHTEDAHRAACQQWISGGRRVAFHDMRDGQWLIAVVDLDTGKERILARDHQLGFGEPTGEQLPIYGCHWNPRVHRDLEFVHAETGELRKIATAAEVEKFQPAWIAEEFSGKPISIFFPVISPDGRKVFFKIAAGAGGDNYQSKAASHRQGIFAYDLDKQRLVFFRGKWGHPAWHPDSQRISEMGNLLFDTADGSYKKIANLPTLRGCHPSISPDGKLQAQDGYLGDLDPTPNQWGVIVCDTRGDHFQVLHRFDNSQGAKSWRKNHPHPVFSADGRRLYFNVNSGEFTQLFVAEIAG
ncbi:MAG: hypothetical protein SFU86_25625 [Pirellulaceae bacterium]|nr:hypothetical protein [Pirellulaceae bacterium]